MRLEVLNKLVLVKFVAFLLLIEMAHECVTGAANPPPVNSNAPEEFGYLGCFAKKI